MRQTVLSVVPDGGSLFEISTPIGVWGADRGALTDDAVNFIPVGIDATDVTLDSGQTMSGLELLDDHLGTADIIVVPTWPVATRPLSDALTERLTSAHDRGVRLVGLCLGAFAVAATGLLDGQTAVTHWKHRERFEALFPNVRFEPNTLYLDHGDLVTSAGSAAAIDCCLHLVRRDHGAEVAATLARSLVAAPHRSGAQSQFASAPQLPSGTDALSTALAMAAEDIASVRGVDDLAALAGSSRRSFERHIQQRLGLSPRVWINEQRVITACRLLETTSVAIDEVARRAGYGSAATMRRALQASRGVTPTVYRSMFRNPASS